MTTVAGRTAPYALAANENPYPPLPSVRAALAGSAAHANRYPDRGVTALTARIAERLQVPRERIVTGAGSVGVLHHLMQALLSPGDEVVFAWPSFEAYPHLTEVCRSVGVRVPLTGSVHDPQALAAAVGERTRLLFVCNPNNPTGTVLGRVELERLLRHVPERVTVVLDEAYREFVTDPQVPDGVALLRTHPGLVVLRTFSKAYGLAGLRVGYAVAAEPVAAAIGRAVVPFGVSAPAQLAALASLDAERELMARVTGLVAERERTWRALTELGLAVPHSEANFLWLPLAADAAAFGAACAAAEVSVRVFDGEGVRVTVGRQAANDAVIEVAKRHLGR